MDRIAGPYHPDLHSRVRAESGLPACDPILIRSQVRHGTGNAIQRHAESAWKAHRGNLKVEGLGTLVESRNRAFNAGEAGGKFLKRRGHEKHDARSHALQHRREARELDGVSIALFSP